MVLLCFSYTGAAFHSFLLSSLYLPNALKPILFGSLLQISCLKLLCALFIGIMSVDEFCWEPVISSECSLPKGFITLWVLWAAWAVASCFAPLVHLLQSSLMLTSWGFPNQVGTCAPPPCTTAHSQALVFGSLTIDFSCGSCNLTFPGRNEHQLFLTSDSTRGIWVSKLAFCRSSLPSVPEHSVIWSTSPAVGTCVQIPLLCWPKQLTTSLFLSFGLSLSLLACGGIFPSFY